MQHVAIDLGGKESWICVRSETGEILEERPHRTASLPQYLRRRPPSRVVVESCSEAFHVADAALESQHQVRVVPATLVRSLGVGSRRTKTDQRDARILSEVSCRIDLPSVHVPTHQARERRSLCAVHEQLVASRTGLVNAVRGWSRQHGVCIPTGTMARFPDRARAAALHTSGGLPEFVGRILLVIEVMNAQIAAANDELQRLAKGDPICQRLMTVPGVGAMTALRFVAAIDDPTRFAHAHSVSAYLGLTPGEHSSSKHKQRTGITKAGPAPVRRVLVLAAWQFQRCRPLDPLVQWTKGVAERRGKFVATVALARKLSGILYAIWRDDSRYEPQHQPRRQREQ